METDLAYLGRGGQRAGVDQLTLNDGSFTLEPLVSLPQAVYALAVSPKQKSLAVGTAEGELILYPLSSPLSGMQSTTPLRLYHRPGITQVGFLNENTLVSIGIDGIGRLWNLPTLESRMLFSASLKILSIGFLSLDRIAGLTVDSTIFLATAGGENQVTKPIPFALPTPSALVHLIYSPLLQVLAHPTKSGEISCWDLDLKQAHCQTVHRGKFTAVTCYSTLWITGGWDDHCLKIWHGKNFKPVTSILLDEPILSLAVLGRTDLSIICTLLSGAVQILRFTGKELTPVAQIPGGEYRTVLGPSPSDLYQDRRTYRRQQVRQTAMKIQNWIAAEQYDQIDLPLSQLYSWGFSPLALSLQIERAYAEKNFPAALSALWQLQSLLRENHPEYLRRMLELLHWLEEFVLLHPAALLREHLHRLFPNISATVLNLSDRIDSETFPILFCNSSYPLDHFLQAAQITQTTCRHRHVLGCTQPVVYPDGNLPLEQVISTYHQIRQANPSLHLPPLQLQFGWWKSHEGMESVQTAITGGGDPTPVSGLGYGVKVTPMGAETQLLPFAFLDLEQIHQANCKMAVAPSDLLLLHQNKIDSWLIQVNRVVKEIVIRLLTQTKGTNSGGL